MFELQSAILRVVYTTNVIESLNFSLRKIIKGRSAFPHDDSVYRLIYIGLEQISWKWTMPIKNWNAALQQFAILYEDRLPLDESPESNQDYGSRAKQSLSDLVFGKTVTVTSSKKDRYGRTLGKVALDGKNINLGQINRGMAWFYRFFASALSREDATAYEQAEAQARKERRGMWADGEQMPPWDYRRSGRSVKAPFWETPTTATGPIVGNRNSKIYHLPNCPDYSKVAERNRVPFNTEAEAQATGYRKARNCP
jgi:hypothetical protein